MKEEYAGSVRNPWGFPTSIRNNLVHESKSFVHVIQK